MPRKERSQRPISISGKDRDRLDAYKLKYEGATGQPSDWGQFLGVLGLVGLAAFGVYKLVESANKSAQSATIKCPHCETNFLMAFPEGSPPAILVACPSCASDLVVKNTRNKVEDA